MYGFLLACWNWRTALERQIADFQEPSEPINTYFLLRVTDTKSRVSEVHTG
jgi:hypothetical protein